MFFMDLSLHDRDSYFTRVNYSGPREPNLDVPVDTMPIRRYLDPDLEAIAGMAGAKAIVERCFPAGQNRVL